MRIKDCFCLVLFLLGTFFVNGRAQPSFNFPGGLDYGPNYSLNEIFDITPDGKKAAVIGFAESGPIGSSQVAIIDTLTGQRFDTKQVQIIGATIAVKIAVLSDGLKVLVMSDNNNGNKYLTGFDLAPSGTLTLRWHTQLNNTPGVSTQGSNVIYSPLTRTAFVAVLSGTNRLFSVNLDTGAVQNNIATSVYDNLNLFEDGTRRLIVSGGINNLVFVDYTNPLQMQILGTVTPPSSTSAFGTHQFSTAFSNDGNYVFVGNGYTLLSVINTSTRQVVGSINSSRYRVRQLKIFEDATNRFLVMRGLEDGSNALKGYAVIDARDPSNMTVVNEIVFGEQIFQMRNLSISRNGRRLLIGSPGKLSFYSLPEFRRISEIPLNAFDSAQITTFSHPDRVFGAWLNKIFSFPNFTNRVSNFDLDGSSDVGIFRPSTGSWQWLRSTDGATATVPFGQADDIPVPADYDGDDQTDLAFFRPSSGEWRIIESSGNVTRSHVIGTGADVPVPADYDGDGKVDIAVFKRRPNRWVVLKSSDGQLLIRKERTGRHKPVVGDYDGDGKADFTIFLNGSWNTTFATGATSSLDFGISGDIPISGDFDNDGKTDISVFQPSIQTWRIQLSYGGLTTRQFGQNFDQPVPADYDGDGKTDIAIFRPSNFTWQILQSTNNSVRTLQFGTSSDVPLTLQK